MKTVTVKFSNGELADLRIPDNGGESLCPVCGVIWLCGMAYYPAEPYATASDDICPGCKMQFGLDDNIGTGCPVGAQAERWKELRIEWLDKSGWAEENLRQLRERLDIDTDTLKKECGK